MTDIKIQSEDKSEDPYYRKFKRVKRTIRDTIFINASLCDEIGLVDRFASSVTYQNRCLLKKLLMYEKKKSNDGDTSMILDSKESTLSRENATDSKSKTKRKTTLAKLESDVSGFNIAAKPKVKKAKTAIQRKTVPPIPLDEFGRPILPLDLGELTIHSLGEICYDKSSFHSPDSIYPVGFCSTRVYAGQGSPFSKCLYTCRISDDEIKPVFEISPEDNSSDLTSADTPHDCHVQLLDSIIPPVFRDRLNPTVQDSLAFFGLTHPVVQNLIQSCPGAKKCTGYHWIRFEINKDLLPRLVKTDEETPTVSYLHLLRVLQT